MPIASIKPYPVDIKDARENFHGGQLLYVGWDRHLMFYSPVCFVFPPEMPFRDLIGKALPQAFGAHPDFAKIDWARVQWLKSGQNWTPDIERSLAGNGLRHKDVLRMRTPGLDGLGGAGF
jgi:phenol/toluene 2-monooxygenase (NADH) P4/A4